MNKYLRAVSANFIFFAIGVIFFLIITPVAIKVMGEEFYGLWAVLLALMLFSNVGNLGIGAIVMKFSSEAPTGDDVQMQSNRVMTAGYFIVLAMAMITAIILLLARNLIANNINTNVEFREQFRQAILWIAASIFPQFLARVPQGFLLSQLHNRAARQIDLIPSILLWLGAIGLAVIEKNLIHVAAWCFFVNMLALGLYFWTVQRLLPFRLRADMPTLRKMLNFSGYMFVESLAITLFQQFDKVVVGFTLGPALAGVYSVGTSIALRLSMLTGQATDVMVPYASLKDSLGDRQKLYITFRQLSRYVSLALAILSSLLIIWMHEILSLWISPDYSSRYTGAFCILIIAYSLLSLSGPAIQTLTGLGKVKITAIGYILSTILMLTCVFFLSRKFGFGGATASNLVLMLLLVLNLFVYHRLHSPIQWKDVLADLQWGLFLPIFTYVLSLFSFALIGKLVETIVLAIFLAWAIARDDFIKARLLYFKQSVLKSWIG